MRFCVHVELFIRARVQTGLPASMDLEEEIHELFAIILHSYDFMQETEYMYNMF